MTGRRLLSPRQRLATAISTALLLQGMGTQAHAQALEEIIVTAQKRLETTQETPVSITALSTSMIEQRGIANTEDLIGEVPGMGGFTVPGTRGATSLSIRGASAGNASNLSLDPVVGLYLDGVYVGKMLGSAMDVAEIERMEILRGPQGTLYGRNSTAGAVNVITRKPTGEFGVRATATVGNYDLWGIKANIDLPALGTVGEGLGELAATLGLQTRQRGAFYENLSGGGDFDTLDRSAWRLALNWQPSHSVVVDYSYDFSELEENGALQKVVNLTPLDASGTDRLAMLEGTVLPTAQFLASMPGADPRIANRWIPSLQKNIDAYRTALARGDSRPDDGWSERVPHSENETSGHALTVEWDAGEWGALGDVTFKSITAYREMESQVSGDLDDIDSRLDSNGVGAYNDLLNLVLLQYYYSELTNLGSPNGAFTGGVWNAIDSLGAFHSLQNTHSEYEQFSQELQMVGTTERLDYTVGLYWFTDEANYLRQDTYLAPLSGSPVQGYRNDTEALAVYGQATYRFPILDDRLSLTTGLRYTEERKGIEYRYGANASLFGNTPAQSADRDNHFYNFSYSVTLAYDLSDEINTFLRTSTGYRSGGFNGEIFDNAFDEETIEQWEIGIKSDWWDKRLRINGSLYQYLYEDLQVSTIKSDSGGDVSSSILNAGEADRWGGELEVMIAPIDDMIVSLSYTYIHGDYEKYPATCHQNVCTDDVRFAQRANAPGNQAGLSVDYTFARTPIGELNLYLQANWQDEWSQTALTTGVLDDGFGGQTPYIYPSQVMDERTVVNARLSLQEIPVAQGNLRLALWVDNLTDEDYPVYGINFAQLGIWTEQYGDPRTYGLEISYEY